MRTRVHQATQHRSAVPGVEILSLASDRVFPRHAHDTFGFGVVLAGGHRSWSGIGPVEAEAGDVITVNPGEMHDGVPIDRRPRSWRMIHCDPAWLAATVADDVARPITFERPSLRDPDLAFRLTRLCAALVSTAPDRLAIEERCTGTLMHLLRRQGPPRRDGPPPAVARALRRLDATSDTQVSLAVLAAEAGVSRFQLLRGFARSVGVTPHAYLVQRRVRHVRHLLAAGQAPAEAAVTAGFADQSHMTRAFVRQFGVTPGRFRAAVV